jgi:hypothetical protein
MNLEIPLVKFDNFSLQLNLNEEPESLHSGHWSADLLCQRDC